MQHERAVDTIDPEPHPAITRGNRIREHEHQRIAGCGARPFFAWNHDVIMRWGGEGLAKLLGTPLIEQGEK